MIATLVRSAASLCFALAAASAALAQPASLPERKLEIRWQTRIATETGRRVEITDTRLRLQDGGQISFGLRLQADDATPTSGTSLALLTLDAGGKVLQRTMLEGKDSERQEVVPLQGGDFLLQIEGEHDKPLFELRRHAADGQRRNAWTEIIDPVPYAMLRDASLLADGSVVAAASLGPGPNDVLGVLVLGPDGKLLSEHRMRILLLGGDGVTRLYPHKPVAGQEQSFDVVSNGSGRAGDAGTGHFRMAYSLDSGVATANLPENIGPETMVCSVVSNDGDRAIFAVNAPNDDDNTLLRAYDGIVAKDWKQALRFQRPLRKIDGCEIGPHADGGGVLWLSPRQLLAFGPDGDLLWRAELETDAIAVAFLPEGDVLALHSIDKDVRMVRYSLH